MPDGKIPLSKPVTVRLEVPDRACFELVCMKRRRLSPSELARRSVVLFLSAIERDGLDKVLASVDDAEFTPESIARVLGMTHADVAEARRVASLKDNEPRVQELARTPDFTRPASLAEKESKEAKKRKSDPGSGTKVA